MLGYNFINSQDVAKYLEDMQYRFSTSDLAWLIKQNGEMTMKERHSAWHDLMQSMEDEPISAGGVCGSVFELLSLYIEEEKRAVARFYEADGTCRYRYRYEYAYEELLEARSAKDFETFEACAESYWKATDEDTILVYVEKWNGESKLSEMVASPSLEEVRLNDVSGADCRLGEMDAILEGMRPSVPLPFSAGDSVGTVVGRYGSFAGVYFLMTLAEHDPDKDRVGEVYGYVATDDGERIRVPVPNPFNLISVKTPRS